MNAAPEIVEGTGDAERPVNRDCHDSVDSETDTRSRQGRGSEQRSVSALRFNEEVSDKYDMEACNLGLSIPQPPGKQLHLYDAYATGMRTLSYSKSPPRVVTDNAKDMVP